MAKDDPKNAGANRSPSRGSGRQHANAKWPKWTWTCSACGCADNWWKRPECHKCGHRWDAHASEDGNEKVRTVLATLKEHGMEDAARTLVERSADNSSGGETGDDVEMAVEKQPAKDKTRW